MRVQLECIVECGDGLVPVAAPVVREPVLEMAHGFHEAGKGPLCVLVEDLIDGHRLGLALDDYPVDFTDTVDPVRLAVGILADQHAHSRTACKRSPGTPPGSRHHR